MTLLWLALCCSTLSAQEILWTAGLSDPVPKTITYSSGVAPSDVLARTAIKNYDKRAIALSFGGGAISGDLFWASLTNSEEGMLAAGKDEPDAKFFHSIETQKLVFKDAQRIEWQQRSFNETPRAANEPMWELTIKFLNNASSSSYRASSVAAGEVVISRAGRDQPFYRGPAGLPLVIALAQAHIKDAGEELTATERDELWTSAFIQVIGLPKVSQVQFVPKKNAFAVSLRGNGLFAGDLQMELAAMSPVPAPQSETFGRGLEQALPTVRLEYADGAVTVREGSLSLEDKIYRAETALR